jgi:glycosyltransferase involved in cell wall biosynthesis
MSSRLHAASGKGPLVSILIPAYNAQEWIGTAIQSALAQTWKAKEIIVVDDGSSDATLAVARNLEAANVKVVSQENQGAAAARNSAYTLCQGDYIQWLDADDVLDPRKIEVQLLDAARHSDRRILLSGAWANFAYRTRKAHFVPTALWQDLTPVEWLWRKMALNLHMQTDNWLVSRELSDAAGPWDHRLWRDNDGEYFCRVLLASDGVAFSAMAKSYYRAAGRKTVSRIDGSSRKLESLFLSMNLHMRYLRSLEDSERTRAACVNYIRTWLHEFFPFRPDLGASLQAAAEALGGERVSPRLSWKYQWLVQLFGWRAARRAQVTLPRIRASFAIAWDRAMYKAEGLWCPDAARP